MNERKNLLIHLGEALERYRAERRESAPPAEAAPVPRGESKTRRILRWWMPNPGTLVLVLALLFAVPALARNAAAPAASSVTTIPYQGRLADINGNPVTERVNMEFRLYDVPTGGTPLWEEFWTGGNAVNVSDGLFSVMLGSINTDLAQTVQGHDTLYLGITVGTDSEMSPRVQLGSVPFSVWSLTVADGSITAEKIATGAVGSDAIADGAVGAAEIATDAVGGDEIAANAVGSDEIAANAVGSSEIASNAVGSDEIAANAVRTSEIAAGAVGTNEIAGGAVTHILHFTTSGNLDTASTNWVDIPGLNRTVTTGNSVIEISFVAADTWNSANGHETKFRILLDGTQMTFGSFGGLGGTGYPANVRIPMKLEWVGSVSSGTHTVSVQWLVSGGRGYIGHNGPASLTIEEFKK